MAKLEIPVRVYMGELEEIINELKHLQTYKLSAEDEQILVDRDDVVKIFTNHIRANIKPERKKGRWQLIEMPFEELEAKCSNCGFKVFVDEPGNGLPMLCDMNFCPSCGADMRGEQDGRFNQQTGGD